MSRPNSNPNNLADIVDLRFSVIGNSFLFAEMLEARGFGLPRGAHIIRDEVLDEPCPLSGVSGRRVVDRHLISRPQFPARDAGDPSRNSREQLIGLNGA